MVASSLVRLWTGFSRRGRSLLRRYAPFAEWEQARTVSAEPRLEALCHALMGTRGEASGVAIAADVLDSYQEASADVRLAFFEHLASHYAPDQDRLKAACHTYIETPTPSQILQLARAAEAPRRELFRRLNLAPGGTSRLVEIRSHLLEHLKARPELRPIDDDLVVLLQSWFNRGFLEMRRLSWSSPADVLERIIRYEAVHSIADWDDLRSRLDPVDRRCFAFFHPVMPNEPLIFVEVALTAAAPDNIGEILDLARTLVEPADARCAVFYSISNCQKGLTGISFGNFLIKQVAADLSRDHPQLRHFVTLSPAPGLVAYLERIAAAGHGPGADTVQAADVERFAHTQWWNDPNDADRLRQLMLPHTLRYFLEAKLPGGKPVDPVARFHLGNGARLERINWLADRSERGLQQSGGIMVNYLYDLTEVEENHEAYALRGIVAAGRPVQQLATSLDTKRPEPTDAKGVKPSRLAIRLPARRGPRTRSADEPSQATVA